MEAKDKYRGDRGASFTTYVGQKIKYAVLDYLRHSRPVNRHYQTRLRKIRKAEEIDPNTVAEQLGLNEREYKATLKMRDASVGPLEDLAFEVACPLPLPVDRVISDDLWTRFAEALEKLPERQQGVLRLYYFEDHTLAGDRGSV